MQQASALLGDSTARAGRSRRGDGAAGRPPGRWGCRLGSAGGQRVVVVSDSACLGCLGRWFAAPVRAGHDDAGDEEEADLGTFGRIVSSRLEGREDLAPRWPCAVVMLLRCSWRRTA